MAHYPFDLKTGVHYISACGVDNPHASFIGVSGTFRSRLMGQHLSDGPRDLVPMTFDSGGQTHGACQ